MSTLANFLSGIFSGLFGWISAWIGSRAALAVAFVTVSVSATAAFYVAIKALVVGVVSTVSYEPFVMGFYAVWPSNAETCLAACLGADVLVFLYRYKVGMLETLAK